VSLWDVWAGCPPATCPSHELPMVVVVPRVDGTRFRTCRECCENYVSRTLVDRLENKEAFTSS
jgi:hypothetical protein